MRLAIVLLLALAAFAADNPKPETVIVTCQAKPGAETALARVLARHWSAARELHLVAESPHLTLRRVVDGKTTFVDIFTWRDADIPDHAPPAIQSIWAEMNKLAEHIDIGEVTIER